MGKVFLRYFLTLFLCSFSLFSSSQEESKWSTMAGEKFKPEFRASKVKVIGAQGNNILLLRYRKKKYQLERYNKTTLVRKVGQEIDLKQGRNRRELEFLVTHGEKILLFTSFRNKLKGKEYLFRQLVDPVTLEVGELIKVAEVAFLSAHNAGGFGYTFSNDSLLMAIYYDYPYVENQQERFGFRLFDKNQRLIREQEVWIPLKDNLFVIQDYEVTNSGEFLISGIVYHDIPQKKKSDKANYHYEVFRFKKNQDLPERLKVDFGGIFISDFKMVMIDDIFCCVGFYGEKNETFVDGIFYLSRGQDGHYQKEKFPLDEKQGGSIKGAHRKLKIRELYKASADNWALVAEQFIVSSSSPPVSNGRGGTTYRNTYSKQYNNIYLLRFSTSKSELGLELIPKKQISRGNEEKYASFLSYSSDRVVYFFYTDRLSNWDEEQTKKKRWSKYSKSCIVSAEANGNYLSQQCLFDSGGYKLIPEASLKSEDSVFLYCKERKSHRLLNLRRNE